MCCVDWLRLGLPKPVTLGRGGRDYYDCAEMLRAEPESWGLGSVSPSNGRLLHKEQAGGRKEVMGSRSRCLLHRLPFTVFFFFPCCFLFGIWLWSNTANGARHIGLPIPLPAQWQMTQMLSGRTRIQSPWTTTVLQIREGNSQTQTWSGKHWAMRIRTRED